MSNRIAIVWDFDKTLIPGYMQEPIFQKYHVNGDDFWKEVNALPEKIKKEQHVRVNPDTIYLNLFIKYAKSGEFKGLNNAVLRELGKELTFYPGLLKNMIYIADGPSDVPAFSTLNKSGGATFAIYPHNDVKAFQQVEQLRKDGRVNMYAEADYSEGTTAYIWITEKIKEIANRIRNDEKAKLQASISATPKHLT